MKETILALDLGTTGNKAILFDERGEPIASAYREFTQHYPKPGWVEHDAEEIWATTINVMEEALAGDIQIAAIGLTNQRETTVIWDRHTGEPIHRAIVWQCRRTAELCNELKRAGREETIRATTGLPVDAYFSGTKVKWLLDNVPGARQRAAGGDLLFGTIDTWILWCLTGGAVHATDYTNASRTMLYDLREHRWDKDILGMLDIPEQLLPEVRNSAGSFGETTARGSVPAGIPIMGVVGDQQAALLGQACIAPGEAKNTYGTGCFLLMNTGERCVFSDSGLITTLACDGAGAPCYALEGAVFVAGAAIQWLRDGLKVITSAPETEQICLETPGTGGVYVVPAFVGLGAPHWDQDARGAVTGITRGTTMQHIIRATVESLAYQSYDVLSIMQRESGTTLPDLRVDGGACANNFLMQFQADIAGIPILRPRLIETTALGAAYLAGLASGFWQDFETIKANREIERTFTPDMDRDETARLYGGWSAAVTSVLTKK